MDHSFETNRPPGGGGGGGGGAGGVRRRPPTAPYPAGPGTGVPSSSHTYGTANDEDSPLLRREDEGGYYGPGTLPSHASRRRHYGPPPPWYRQPHKLILAATLAWAGGVMYLASLAHALLRTHKETARAMGSNLNDADFQAWLESQASARQLARKNKYGDGSGGSGSSSGSNGNSNSSGSGTRSGKASDEDVTEWIESQGSRNSNAYGAGWDQDEDFQKWLEEEASNRYGSPLSNVESAVGEERADFQAWMGARANKLGSSGGTSDSDLTFDEEVQKWLETHYGYGASAENIEDFQKWMEERSYGASAQDVEDSQKRMESRTAGGSGYGSTGGNVKGNNKNVNVRFGSGNPNYEDWKEYREKNKHVKYDAEGQNGRRNNNLGLARATADQSLSSKDRFQQKPAAAAATSDADASSVSTIDWPLQGLPHASCTSQNGCSPNANVTVLVVYGPEYHTHIAEMAWNVATGVHQAFKNHIRHHPSTPLHGHIVFGTTGNLTFLDVIDADAVIIGSPVYNGNVHPDVQNWINYWHIDADLSNKFGGAFATAGGIHAGADGTVMSILRSMMVFQMMAVGGDSWTSPFGAVATMYEDPFGDTQRTDYFDDSCYFTQENGRAGDHLVHPYFLRKAYGLGERIANVTVAWKNSSYVRWS